MASPDMVRLGYTVVDSNRWKSLLRIHVLNNHCKDFKVEILAPEYGGVSTISCPGRTRPYL